MWDTTSICPSLPNLLKQLVTQALCKLSVLKQQELAQGLEVAFCVEVCQEMVDQALVDQVNPGKTPEMGQQLIAFNVHLPINLPDGKFYHMLIWSCFLDSLECWIFTNIQWSLS